MMSSMSRIIIYWEINMQNIKCKKRINRIIAGLVSAAMAFTMVPDVWLPVHAEIVSNRTGIYYRDNQELLHGSRRLGRAFGGRVDMA